MTIPLDAFGHTRAPRVPLGECQPTPRCWYRKARRSTITHSWITFRVKPAATGHASAAVPPVASVGPRRCSSVRRHCAARWPPHRARSVRRCRRHRGDRVWWCDRKTLPRRRSARSNCTTARWIPRTTNTGTRRRWSSPTIRAAS